MPKQSIDLDSLLTGFVSTAISSIDRTEEVSIVEFAESIVFNGEVSLFLQQRALLKSFYNEELTPEEQLVLEEWKENNGTGWVEGRHYQNLILEAGRGSSKSSIAAIIALYEFYGLITLKNPAKHYGLIPNDPIGIFVIAQTLDQVKDTLYAKIKGYAEDSFFFKSLQETGKIEILAESIKCPSKNVAIYAKHTNSPALVGYTLKCLIIDELARFENRVELDGTITSMADELFFNVGKGIGRFGKYGRRVAISSAWATNDPMERLREITSTDPSTLSFQLKTWDLNKLPSMSRETYNTEYITNSAKAELEYECIRSTTQRGFISASLLYQASLNYSCLDSRQVPLDVEIQGITKHYVANEIIRIAPDSRVQSYAHVDFSVKRDATALCVCHAEREEDRWIIKVDALVRWQPHLDHMGVYRVVSYQNVEDTILLINENRNLRKVTFDSFNAESSIQKLHSIGIPTEQLSTTRQAQLTYYTLFRDLVLAGLVHLPKDSINLQPLITELINIIIKDNGQVTHDIAGKDLADGVVNSVYSTYQELLKQGVAVGTTLSVDSVKSTTRPRPNNKLKVGKAINRLYSSMKRK